MKLAVWTIFFFLFFTLANASNHKKEFCFIAGEANLFLVGNRSACKRFIYSPFPPFSLPSTFFFQVRETGVSRAEGEWWLITCRAFEGGEGDWGVATNFSFPPFLSLPAAAEEEEEATLLLAAGWKLPVKPQRATAKKRGGAHHTLFAKKISGFKYSISATSILIGKLS